MKNYDSGMDELIEALKTHPELVSALVFDPESIKRFLKGKSSRRLVGGVNFKAFLKYVAGPKNGGPVVRCVNATRVLSPLCPGGSRRPPPIRGLKR